MKVLTVLSHPNQGSFSSAIAERLVKEFESLGETVVHRSLYQEEFYPVLPLEELKSSFSFDPLVQKYIDDVETSDVLLFIHPDWWGQVPALLKGWLDRVLRPGVAYEYRGEEYQEKHLVPLLQGKRGYVIITTDQPFSESTKHYFEELWNNRIFSFCGIEPRGVEVYYDMYHSTYGDRLRWMENLTAHLPSILCR